MTTTDRYINPFTDFGFKKLFGSEMNKDLLIAFLNTLLPIEAGTIADLTFLPNDRVGRSEFDRRAIFDLHCKNEKGEYFIVEMQQAKQDYFKDRSVFYASFPIQEQAQKGKWNYCLQPIYMVGILDFIFDENKADDTIVHHEIKLVNLSTGKVFYEKLTFIYLELPKFTKSVDELESDFDKWCYLLSNLPDLTDRPARLQEKVFLKVFELAEIAKYTPEEAREYEKSLKVYRDLKNVIDCAYDEGKAEGIEEGIEKGKEIGVLEGMVKGKELGLQEGLQKGMEAGLLKGKLEIARKLMVKGMSADEAAGIAGVDVERLSSNDE
uniref:Rpn family recombination-promoting nuclease/putative transposase n=1 Tax=Chlorobium chlorochromatii (strain CaD3) TaxID=340177 RepID=Q3ARM2_CHLCH